MLGGGGGGDVAPMALFAREVLRRHGPAALLDLDELPDDALVMPCGVGGSPTLADERLLGDAAAAELQAAVEDVAGRPVAAVMAFEIGGGNGLVAAAWAARLGLPLVDADGMGRGATAARLMRMHLAGVPASPAVVVGDRGASAVLRSPDIDELDRCIRAAIDALGGVAPCALFLMAAATARAATIRGTVSSALALGTALSATDGDPAQAAAAALGGHVVVGGKIIEVERHPGQPWSRGSVTIASLDDPPRLVRVEFQNENLAALEQGRVVAAIPDVITLVDRRAGVPLVTEHYRYGQRVALVVSRTDPAWYGERALAVAGPAAFGLELPAPAPDG